MGGASSNKASSPGKAQAQASLRREVYTPQVRAFCTGDTSISQQWPALVTRAPRKWSWVTTDKDKGNPWAKHATLRPAGHFLYSQEFRQQTNARDFSPSFNLLHSPCDHENIIWIRNHLENTWCVFLFSSFLVRFLASCLVFPSMSCHMSRVLFIIQFSSRSAGGQIGDTSWTWRKPDRAV